jgi:hypothetical protein
MVETVGITSQAIAQLVMQALVVVDLVQQMAPHQRLVQDFLLIFLVQMLHTEQVAKAKVHLVGLQVPRKLELDSVGMVVRI